MAALIVFCSEDRLELVVPIREHTFEPLPDKEPSQAIDQRTPVELILNLIKHLRGVVIYGFEAVGMLPGFEWARFLDIVKTPISLEVTMQSNPLEAQRTDFQAQLHFRSLL